jgi:transporter family protein
VNWLGFSLMALGLWGVWGFLSKIAAQQLPAQAVYLLSISGHLGVIAYLGASGGLAIPWHPWGVATAVVSGVCMAFGLLAFFQALAGGPATLVVPLTALYPAITVILGGVFLQESLSLRHLAGLALALGAVWLLAK